MANVFRALCVDLPGVHSHMVFQFGRASVHLGTVAAGVCPLLAVCTPVTRQLRRTPKLPRALCADVGPLSGVYALVQGQLR